MKVLIFYQAASDHSRVVEEFVHEFGRRYPGSELTLLDVNTADGAHKAEVYDILSYPCVLAIENDGSTLQRWDNGMMPLMNEVDYYTNH